MMGMETFRTRLEKYHTFPNEELDKKARESRYKCSYSLFRIYVIKYM